MKILRHLTPKSRGWLDSLLAPAADPRQTFADVVQRQQDLLARLRQARTSIAVSRERLEAKIAEGRSKLALLEEQAREPGREPGRDDLTPFVLQLRRRAAEEIHALEAELRTLRQEEEVLPLVEQRLVAEIDALHARREVQAARHSSTEAQVRVQEALGGIAEEVAGLSLALEQAEQRTEQLQSRASAIDQLVELGLPQAPGRSTGDPAARRLALRFSFEAGNEEMGQFQEQLQAGLQVVQQLIHEYEQLKPVLVRRRATDSLSVAYVPALAEETYRQGMSVLEHALELARALRSPGTTDLDADIAALEREGETAQRETAQRQAAPSEPVPTLPNTLATLTERRDALRRHRARVDELIRHAGRCQASLQQARIELASLNASNSAAGVNAVTATLMNTLQQAREVQEELTKDGAG